MCRVPTCGGGGAFCAHNLRRSLCSDPACGGGGALCKHGTERCSCKETECGGALCKHGLRPNRCKECSSINVRIATGLFCIVCTEVQLSPQRRRAGIRLCATCDPLVPKRIELVVRPLLVEAIGTAATIADNAALGGTGCDAPRRRPDLLFVRAGELPQNIAAPGVLVDGRAVCLEIDENGGHPDREPSCEAAKIWDQTAALKQLCGESLRVFVVRFNPGRYDGARVTLEERIAKVAGHVRWLLETGWRKFANSTGPHVSFLYYHSECLHHVEYIRAKSDSFNLYLVAPRCVTAPATTTTTTTTAPATTTTTTTTSATPTTAASTTAAAATTTESASDNDDDVQSDDEPVEAPPKRRRVDIGGGGGGGT